MHAAQYVACAVQNKHSEMIMALVLVLFLLCFSLPSSAVFSGRCGGGIARMKTYVDQQRGEDPDLLLLNAGDDFIGTQWDREYGSKAAAVFLNKLAPDAMVRKAGGTEGDAGMLHGSGLQRLSREGGSLCKGFPGALSISARKTCSVGSYVFPACHCAATGAECCGTHAALPTF